MNVALARAAVAIQEYALEIKYHDEAWNAGPQTLFQSLQSARRKLEWMLNGMEAKA